MYFSCNENDMKDKLLSEQPDRILWVWHSGFCSSLAKMHSWWWLPCWNKEVFCSIEFALSNSVIMLFVHVVVSMELNQTHYFQSDFCIYFWFCKSWHFSFTTRYLHYLIQKTELPNEYFSSITIVWLFFYLQKFPANIFVTLLDYFHFFKVAVHNFSTDLIYSFCVVFLLVTDEP